jgi:Tfp pilus assembly protein PilX
MMRTTIMSYHQHRLNKNQQGIVSIMMTIVMILVISLIVLGLAQISRREVRKATDTQLSSQAFYAAESGVNDVINLIHANGDVATPNPTCTLTAPYSTGLTPTIAPGISYSCVIVDPASNRIPGDISSSPSVYSLATTSATGLSSVTFKWGPGGGQSTSTIGCSTAALGQVDVFPTASPTNPWSCHYAVLRVDLVNAASLDRAALINATKTYFLVPNRTGSVGSGSSILQGASCSGGVCSATINMSASNSYYARVTGIYTDGSLTICGNGCAAEFADQVTIDVTGKAQDVLRRVKVSVNLNGGNQNSEAAAAIMSGDSICKRFKLNQNGTATGDYGGFPTCN